MESVTGKRADFDVHVIILRDGKVVARLSALHSTSGPFYRGMTSLLVMSKVLQGRDTLCYSWKWASLSSEGVSCSIKVVTLLSCSNQMIRSDTNCPGRDSGGRLSAWGIQPFAG